MEATAWKEIWTWVFCIASAMFYGTVIVVAYKGIGDVVAMIREMFAARRGDSGP